MNPDKEIKEVVKDKYAEIAIRSDIKSGCGCGCGCGPESDTEFTIMSDEYSSLDGYVPDADLKLGCGIPTEHAGIKQGDTVLDLGSGAGNDVFVARVLVGETGKVIGIDFTPEMIAKAERNKQKLGYKNVEFRPGEIENIPVEDNSIDVVISNCVLNLVPDKDKAFGEIFRVLKSGAHFCVSDIVLKGELPESIQKSAAMYAGCVAGALQMEDYLGVIKKSGFKNIEVKTEKKITVPDEVLLQFLSREELSTYRNSGVGIYSITVNAEK
ncbi:MAG: methyltransferase domain-containing protein [Ignavibacteriales bacterium]|nr:MAG: methyltransferase domain-containing protein [Ignavibacteriales bacterium]